MKLLILDGSPAGDRMGDRLFARLEPLLIEKGHEFERIVLRERKIAPCTGCFKCWIESPGLCTMKDDSLELDRKFIRADLLVSLTPVVFGGYAPELKKMYDRLIPNISPFFASIDGETHHQKRYDAYPDLLTIGWLDRPDKLAESLFSQLVYRNSINFYASACVAGLMYATQKDEELASGLQELLERIEHRERIAESSVPMIPADKVTASPVNRAVLLVGSPRMSKSSSAAVGGYLLDRLAQQGVAAETFQVYQTLKDENRWRQLMEWLNGADLVLLSFPVYIDNLPAPLLSALQKIVRDRQGSSGGALVAVANCGFIEAVHTDHALASCALFARAAGLSWKGSIAIGGGEGLVRQKPLEEQQGPVVPLKKALDKVALALGAGGAVPEEARSQIARPFVPAWLFRLFAGQQWKKEATRLGTRNRLHDRPHLHDVA